MKKDKFNLNPAPINEDDIAKGKDFSAFHKQYEAQKGTGPSGLLKRLALPTLAAAALITIAVLVFRSPDRGVAAVADFIAPPLPGIERMYELTAFQVGEGLVLDLPSGTKINIPANAFVDASGQPYNGEAVLKYREYTDPVAIALSGIPMVYDSAGVRYAFESAGMFDLVVEAKPGEGQAPIALALADGSVISVGMPTEMPEEAFNVYELDTVNRNWALRGADSLALPPVPDTDPAPVVAATNEAPKKKKEEVTDAKLGEMYRTIQFIQDSIDYYRGLSLIKPIKSSTEAHVFHLDRREYNYPELVLNELLSWEVAPRTPGFDSRFLSTRWDSHLITRIEGTKYNIHLVKGETAYDFECKPVYHGNHYQTALKYYEKQVVKNDERLAYLELKLQDWKDKYNAYKASLQADKGSNKQDYTEKEKQYLDEYNVAATTQTVYRFVQVSRTGIWNLDRIYNQPEYVRAETEFVDDKGVSVAMHRVILFEKGINSSFEYYKMPEGNSVRVLIDPAKKYSGLGITTEGKVFVLNSADIAQLKTEGITKLTVKDLFIPKSEEQVRAKLKGAV